VNSANVIVIEFVCGFSGSAGVAVITAEKAALSTDGRYFNQAEKQLDTNWELLKQGMTDVPTWGDWYVHLLDQIDAEYNAGPPMPQAKARLLALTQLS
jgi:hypothetical protein